jgi:dipeptidyl aminopeptidase/acylaminoacyl peptidase
VTLQYDDHVASFARHGYIVFHPAYRGHGRSEGQAPNDPFISPHYVTDALNGLAAVQTYPDADPARIGMWGHSMGGYVTLQAMVVLDEIDAGVIWAGVVGGYPDLFARDAATATAVAVASPTITPAPGTPTAQPPANAPFPWPRLATIYGSPEENPAFWRSISATAYLADLSGPLQLHHALDDAQVPAAASILLQGHLEAAGQPSELYLYEDDTHSLGRNFDLAMERTLAFLDKHVKHRNK